MLPVVERDWADGRRRFCLRLAEWEELEDKRDCGLARLFARLSGDDARMADVRETIRLGLIGAGAPPAEALTLVRRYVEERRAGWFDNVLLAAEIIAAALSGKVGEPLEPAPGKDQATPMTQGDGVASTSAPSTPPAP